MIHSKEISKTAVLFCTDQSAAYDTVDHEILLRKLQHYGLRCKIHNIIKSYLSDRSQFIELDTFKSNVRTAPNCSVV